MTNNFRILFISEDDLSSHPMMKSLTGQGYDWQMISLAEKAALCRYLPHADYIVCNFGKSPDPTLITSYLSFAKLIKSARQKNINRLLAIGLHANSFNLTDLVHFDDILFGPLNFPALFSKMKKLKRLTIIERELDRRFKIIKKYNPGGKIVSKTSLPERIRVLVTGSSSGITSILQSLPETIDVVEIPPDELAKIEDGSKKLNGLTRDNLATHVDLVLINGDNNPERFFAIADLIRSIPKLYNLPVLMISRPHHLSFSHIGYEGGITDYIELPLNSLELNYKISSLVRDFIKHRQNHEIKVLAPSFGRYRSVKTIPFIDELTHLYSHSFLNEYLNTLLSEGDGTPHTNFCLASFKIDNLKLINDKYGAVTGDQILAEIGQIISNLVRSEDLPARFGGRHFMVIMPGTELSDAKQVLNRLCGVIHQTRFMAKDINRPVEIQTIQQLLSSPPYQHVDQMVTALETKYFEQYISAA